MPVGGARLRPPPSPSRKGVADAKSPRRKAECEGAGRQVREGKRRQGESRRSRRREGRQETRQKEEVMSARGGSSRSSRNFKRKSPEAGATGLFHIDHWSLAERVGRDRRKAKYNW